MKTQALTTADLSRLNGLQPPDWNDVKPHLEYYLASPWCQPVKVEHDDRLVGIGTTVAHEDSVWLAHIIVHPEYRSQGIGSLIVKSLVDSVRSYDTILLVATELGVPIYLKAGFEIVGEYAFYEKEREVNGMDHASITPFQEKYTDAILNLDRTVTDENRRVMLMQHITNARVFVADDDVKGFYCPTFGEGLIVAKDEETGKALMQCRWRDQPKSCLPAENEAAIRLTEESGFKYIRGAKRMSLGRKRKFQPSYIYNRVSGQIG